MVMRAMPYRDGCNMGDELGIEDGEEVLGSICFLPPPPEAWKLRPLTICSSEPRIDALLSFLLSASVGSTGSSDFRSLNPGDVLVSVKEIRVFDAGKALTGLVVNTASIEDVLTPG